jgi:peptidoglycan/xylan/chitin deacetylase (PgdA/CDA1 family)
MYSRSNRPLSELPSKTICLTYDDGPGAHTDEIARFLSEYNIRATFFVVGKYAYHHQDILQKISDLGHIIGNHTYSHPDLPYYQSVDGEIHYQIIRTDLVIRKFINQKKVFFRAPYGKWSAEVADELNSNMLSSLNHIGPIHWDIEGIDCFYWKNEWTVDDAVTKYLEELSLKDHGIIVMHDDIADMDVVKPKNKTLELTKKLVPILLARGFRFIGLDEIESVKADLAQVEKFKLRGSSNGKYIRLVQAGSAIRVDGSKNDPMTDIILEDLGHGKVALKMANGHYLSSGDAAGDGLTATGTSVGMYESFDMMQLKDSLIVLRTATGNFLNIDRKHGESLVSTVEFMRQAEIFSFVGPKTPDKHVNLRRKLFLIKKRLLFIKSKMVG